MPIGKTVHEVQTHLVDLEDRMQELQMRKKSDYIEAENAIGVLKADRESFKIETYNRVQQLKNYLDDKMRQAISDFNRVTE
jgi:hypothetical protein